MLKRLRSFVASGPASEVVRECRDCGTVVDHSDRCPNCESAAIAQYEID